MSFINGKSPQPAHRLVNRDGYIDHIWYRFIQRLLATDNDGTISVTQEDPHAPTLLNSWEDYSAGQAVRYWRDSVGVVHLQGIAKSGTPGADPVFVLPAQYRPSASRVFPVASNGAFGYCTIASNGEVSPTAGDTAWFSFDGISFLAEQ